MKCVLDGNRIHDVRSFASELARNVREATGKEADFGWELHSLADHLQGGYGGTPPYEVVVDHAEGMLAEMGHGGLVRYCDEMLKVIESGGRGMVQAEDRKWYEATRARAHEGHGDTLLDLLFEAVRKAPAELTLRSGLGDVLRR
jgi:hypothetical protein